MTPFYMASSFQRSHRTGDIREGARANRVSLPSRLTGDLPKGVMPAVEAKELITRYQATGNVSLRNKVLEGNMPLIMSMAQRYHCDHISIEDLISEGVTGFLAGIEKYDCRERAAVASYCANYVKKFMLAYLDNNQGPVKVSVRAVKALTKNKRAEIERMVHSLERETIPLDIMMGSGQRSEYLGVLDLRSASSLTGIPPRSSNPEDTQYAVARMWESALSTESGYDRGLHLAEALKKLDENQQIFLLAVLNEELPAGATNPLTVLSEEQMEQNVKVVLKALTVLPGGTVEQAIEEYQPEPGLSARIIAVYVAAGCVQDDEMPELFTHPLLPFSLFDEGDGYMSLQVNSKVTLSAGKIVRSTANINSLVRGFNPGYNPRKVGAQKSPAVIGQGVLFG